MTLSEFLMDRVSDAEVFAARVLDNKDHVAVAWTNPVAEAASHTLAHGAPTNHEARAGALADVIQLLA